MSSGGVFLGGTMNRVIKIGEVVHRQVKGHPMLHTYLQYLEKEGMPGVPRFLGIDEQKREMLTYVPGDTAASILGFDHPCLHSDQTICDMAQSPMQNLTFTVRYSQSAKRGKMVLMLAIRCSSVCISAKEQRSL